MLMASLPLPHADANIAGLESAPLRLLDDATLGVGTMAMRREACIGSARLQLAYPWVATPASAAQPEGIEAPEGVLMGAIARSALNSGAFASAAQSPLPSVTATVPELGTAAIRASLAGGAADWTGDLLCLIGRKTGTMMLISDATMSENRDWRAGGVSRLMGIILRAALWLGQERLFEGSGQRLWANLRLDLEAFLDRLWQLGALSGSTAAKAYSVRCDETTMRQADIDAGRTIVSITFTAAQPIQRIAVTLSLADAGILSRAEAA
jgi:phage tail sheath protein FI